MKYEYKRFTGGLLGSNTYLLWNPESKRAIVIDPGNPAEETEAFARSLSLTVSGIVLTHGHYDHVCYMSEYKKLFQAPVLCTRPECENLAEPYRNASVLFGSAVKYPPADVIVDEGSVIPLDGQGKDGPVVLCTPGHTSGGICILAGQLLFTGDTLFYGNFGRTDLGDGSTAELKRSIERLYAMDPALIVLPGHGTQSTIGREREENPFWMF